MKGRGFCFLEEVPLLEERERIEGGFNPFSLSTARKFPLFKERDSSKRVLLLTLIG